MFMSNLLAAAPNWGDFSKTIKSLFDSMFTPLLTIVISLTAIWGLYLGVKFARSAGDENRRKEAKNAIVSFVIGVIVIFLVAGAAPLLIGALSEWLSSTT